MKAQFILIKQAKKKEALPVIYLQVFDSRFRDRKFLYSTGWSIDHKFWSETDHLAKIKKSSPQHVNQRLHAMNNHLRSLKIWVDEFQNRKFNSLTLDNAELKAFIKARMDDDQKKAQEQKSEENKQKDDALRKESEFFKVWQTILDTTRVDGKPIASGTMASKKQTLSKFTSFANTENYKPTFENIGKDIYSRFLEYMEKAQLGPNTRGRHIKELKAILREAEDRGYKVNPAYRMKSFKVTREDVESIFLNEAQLRYLLEGEFDEKLTPAEVQQRDIFVAASLVGARHSDWHQIRRSNIENTDDGEMIRIKQKKTNKIVHIPVHPAVNDILLKYDGVLPRIISNQKFNAALKEIGRKAKLNKWDRLSTHTARRSFCTNCYLADMDVHQIMEFSGHKTEASFLKYLKLNGLDYARKASKNKFFSGESWGVILKVA